MEVVTVPHCTGLLVQKRRRAMGPFVIACISSFFWLAMVVYRSVDPTASYRWMDGM
jgi:hypothetical protein